MESISEPTEDIELSNETDSDSGPAVGQPVHTYILQDRFKKHNRTVYKDVVASPLTSSYESQDFRGLLNLSAIVVFVIFLRQFLENLIKYGILLDLKKLMNYFDGNWIFYLIGLQLHVIFAVLIERNAVKNPDSDAWAVLNILNVGSLLIVPVFVVYIINPSFVSALFVLVSVVIMFMKLVSFSLVNRDYRIESFKNHYKTELDLNLKCVKGGELLTYPQNLTYKNIYYFMACPVLCYQMNYPRTKKIRWYWVSGKIFQFLFLTSVQVFLFEQWIMPTIHGSVVHIQSGNVLRMVERLLKLSIPSVIIWILGFYNIFHLFLNILAEFLRFADRKFYDSWWNATTLGEYWRLWNTPVHHWLHRHVYFPAIRRGMGKLPASILIFFISACFHELLVSVPLHLINFHFFFGMMAQIPVILFTENYFKGSTFGNFFFWFTFCIVGQPMVLLLYYHDWYNANTV
eukprot:TRINITY_DN2914_c0_g1_i2.p1 TRINITY_DN2914_c0_g1~~TRINITY_DN2914_c0_g1_i2.p1  ORF type:complete len:471 (-),score=43.11 TRINITY_DN2914_c0_g1_i2:641-2017(-)